MKRVLKRVLLTVMVMLLAVSVIVPAAMATELPVTSNASSAILYVGMRDTVRVTLNGVKQNPSLYRWKSSNSNVVSVNSKGTVTAKKIGTATVTATRKSNGSRVALRLSVYRNKVDNINSRPSAQLVNYGGCGWTLKSLEIASPSKVVAEFYLVGNYAYNKGIRSISSFTEDIYAADDNSNLTTIASGKSSSVTGFKAAKGKFVKVVKVTFKGSTVKNVNLRLSKYRLGIGSYGRVTGVFY